MSKNNQIKKKLNQFQNLSDTKTCMISKTYKEENIVQTIATIYKDKLQITVTCI